MMDFTGKTLDNYRLIRTIGSGGFSSVYLGEDIHSKKLVAVKVLEHGFKQDDLKIIEKEIRNQIRLSHPYIVKIIDFGMFHTPPFIVTEYAPHGTLRQRHLAGTQVSLPIVVHYVEHIAEVLQYAHDMKLIHRDVKPENLLLNANDEILLADFGLALVVEHRPQSMLTQAHAGTECYMSPEQSRGKPHINSDQYSLAILAYEWLCGFPPFQADDPGDPFDVMIKHRQALPPSLKERVPTIPLAVEEAIMIALRKQPEERFESVQAFADALKAAYRQELMTSGISSAVFTPQTPTKQEIRDVELTRFKEVQTYPMQQPGNEPEKKYVVSTQRNPLEHRVIQRPLLSSQASVIQDHASSHENNEETVTLRFAIGKLNDFLQWFASVLEVMLFIRFILKLVGADPNNLLVGFLYALTNIILYPFSTIVTSPVHQNQAFEWSTLIAMIIYWLIFWAFRRFLRILISEPEELEN